MYMRRMEPALPSGTETGALSALGMPAACRGMGHFPFRSAEAPALTCTQGSSISAPDGRRQVQRPLKHTYATLKMSRLSLPGCC